MLVYISNLLFISKIEPVGVRLNLTPMGRDQLGPYHPLVYNFFIHPRECGHLTTTIYMGIISTDMYAFKVVYLSDKPLRQSENGLLF
jgi:hypothetical protein